MISGLTAPPGRCVFLCVPNNDYYKQTQTEGERDAEKYYYLIENTFYREHILWRAHSVENTFHEMQRNITCPGGPCGLKLLSLSVCVCGCVLLTLCLCLCLCVCVREREFVNYVIRMCSPQNVFSIECVLYKIVSVSL